MDDDYHDAYVERLQTTIHKIKQDRDMGARYMVFERLLKEEHKAGKAEGKAEGIVVGQKAILFSLLADLGDIPEELKQSLYDISEENQVTELCRIAAHATSMEEFIQKSNIMS